MTERPPSAAAATRRGVHDRLIKLADERGAGPDPVRRPDYSPGRTLRLRVEFARQLKRRRTQVTFGLLLVLPLIIAIAFQVGGTPRPGAPGMVELARTGGFNFALFTEFASSGFLLVVVVALFCGDTVASEASWSSLRYLLAAPVPRARLLRQKLIVAGVLCVAANLALPVWSFVIGGLFFGWGPMQSPVGGSFGAAPASGRLLLIVGYVCIQFLVVTALAFLLSVSVDNPLGAVGGAVLLVVVSNILDQITALDPYRQYLPTHFSFAWVDTLSAPIRWDDMYRGTGVALIYGAVFLALAWLRFDRKDITS
jgi:ABC-2 type transport system permease protein